MIFNNDIKTKKNEQLSAIISARDRIAIFRMGVGSCPGFDWVGMVHTMFNTIYM